MPDIIWSANKTSFTYQGDTFSIPLFRSLVQNLIAKGERLLNDCLITAESDPFASLSVNEAQFLERIKENPAEGTNGYSFLSDHRNNWLQPLQQAVLEAILGSTKLKEKYLTCQKDGNILWKVNFIKFYTSLVDRLLEVLLLLIHISGGQPARSPEILDLTLWNSPTRRRNLHVIDGRVMVITRYHKSMHRTDKAKVISRFLPVNVSALLL
ncbi:hypothetical protein L211DRAFT_799093, partial [Terfezia boudieri ATCC MYA-4762]